MKRLGFLAICFLSFAFLFEGCASLKEVRVKAKVGPEALYDVEKGTTDSRLHLEPGLSLKFKNGITFGTSYRHRAVNLWTKKIENGVFFDISIPVWEN